MTNKTEIQKEDNNPLYTKPTCSGADFQNMAAQINWAASGLNKAEHSEDVRINNSTIVIISALIIVALLFLWCRNTPKSANKVLKLNMTCCSSPYAEFVKEKEKILQPTTGGYKEVRFIVASNKESPDEFEFGSALHLTEKEMLEQYNKYKKLEKEDPDEKVYTERRMKFEKKFRQLINYEKVYRNIVEGKYTPGRIVNLLGAIDDYIKDLEGIRSHAEFLENEEHVKAADVYIAQLKVSRWMLVGGNGEANFPDGDDKVKGVLDREEALDIANKYKTKDFTQKEVVEFMNLRKFIAQKLINQYEQRGFSLFSKKIFWNGKILSDCAELKKEVQECENIRADDNIRTNAPTEAK